MRNPIVPHTSLAPGGRSPGALGGSFVQGFVAAGCVSAFQDRPSTACPADLKRVLRHALQGGTALAAGSHAAMALRQQDYTRVLVAAAAGAAGVLLIERLLRDAAQARQENKDA
ncbi:MAG: hypothetical protein ACYC5W_12040 [Thauera sp.]